MQPRPAHANRQLAGIIQAYLYIAQVEAEQAEKADEVRFDERDLLQVGELVMRDADIGQLLDLVADFRQVRCEVLAVTAAEFPFHLGVGIVVQHRLHHGDLVEVGVQQVLDDAWAENAVAHGRSSLIRESWWSSAASSPQRITPSAARAPHASMAPAWVRARQAGRYNSTRKPAWRNWRAVVLTQ